MGASREKYFPSLMDNIRFPSPLCNVLLLMLIDDANRSWGKDDPRCDSLLSLSKDINGLDIKGMSDQEYGKFAQLPETSKKTLLEAIERKVKIIQLRLRVDSEDDDDEEYPPDPEDERKALSMLRKVAEAVKPGSYTSLQMGVFADVLHRCGARISLYVKKSENSEVKEVKDVILSFISAVQLLSSLLKSQADSLIPLCPVIDSLLASNDLPNVAAILSSMSSTIHHISEHIHHLTESNPQQTPEEVLGNSSLLAKRIEEIIEKQNEVLNKVTSLGLVAVAVH